MADIVQDPVKLVMLVILLSIEIFAVIALAVGWIKDCKGAKKGERENEK